MYNQFLTKNQKLTILFSYAYLKNVTEFEINDDKIIILHAIVHVYLYF